MLTILNIEPILWKTWIPQTIEDFPCMICHDSIAILFLSFSLDDERMKPTGRISVCQNCATLESAEIMMQLKRVHT